MACGPARAELVLFYDFNDASDPNLAPDLSGNGNDAEVIGAEYTGSGEGRTGGAGDMAMDFLNFSDQSYISVLTAPDGAFDSLTDNDAATIAFWLFGGDEEPVNQWTFWFGPDRQLGSHVPWGNGTVYFDVAGCCNSNQRLQQNEPDDQLYRDNWNHYTMVKDGELTSIYQNGELWADSDTATEGPGSGPKDPLGDIFEVAFGAHSNGGNSINGLMDDIGVWDTALSEEEIRDVMENGLGVGEPRLQAGDANQDLQFNQIDLVQVQIAAKYLTGQPATWGEGDWDGSPGGKVGEPPPGDGQFNQLDIIAALNAGTYLTGPYAALSGSGTIGDGQASITYDARTGELGVDAPAGTDLTSINIDSASGIFMGDAAQNLGGSFDNDADNNIFKATFGSSFGSLSFGNVAQTGLSEEFVLNDLTAVGSLAGGGDLGAVDLVYVPEPSTLVLTLLAVLMLMAGGRRK